MKRGYSEPVDISAEDTNSAANLSAWFPVSSHRNKSSFYLMSTRRSIAGHLDVPVANRAIGRRIDLHDRHDNPPGERAAATRNVYIIGGQ